MRVVDGDGQLASSISGQSESELSGAFPPPIDNSSYIRYREGAHIVLLGGPSLSSQSIFRIAIIGSMALRGKPVRCVGIVPGVVMVIAAGNVIPRDGADADQIADKLWNIFRPQLIGWLTARAAPGGMHMTVSHGIQIDCGHEGRYTLPQAVMQIEARYDAVFAASFVKLLRQGRLIEPEAGSDDDMRSLVKTAIDCCVRSEDDIYARLPLPVRYRASGAIDAWKAVRRAAGREGEAFSRSLAQEEIGTLRDEFADCLHRWCGRPLSAIAGESGEQCIAAPAINGKFGDTGDARTSRCSRTAHNRLCASWCLSGRRSSGRIGSRRDLSRCERQAEVCGRDGSFIL